MVVRRAADKFRAALSLRRARSLGTPRAATPPPGPGMRNENEK
jgi:hypothetical protein